MHSLISNFDGCCRSYNYSIKGLCVYFMGYFSTIYIVTKKSFFWLMQLWVTDLFFSCVYDTIAYVEFIIFIESEK